MNWKSFLCFLLSYCLAAFPAHAKAPSTHEMLLGYFQNAKVTKGAKVSDWLRAHKDDFHPKIANLAERYALLNPDETFPDVKFTSFKTKEGQEIVRIVAQEGNKSTLVDVITQDEKTYFQIDGKKYTYEDLYYDGHFENAVSSPFLTVGELKEIYEIDKSKAILYQNNLRKLADALMELRTSLLKSGKDVAKWNLILPTAFAENPFVPPPPPPPPPAPAATSPTAEVDIAVERRCIMAGFPAVVSAGSCGGGVTGLQCDEFGKEQTHVRCNPLVYGYEEGGKVHCVKREPATSVSPQCDSLFPIPSKTEELIRSLAGANPTQAGRDKFYRALNKTIRQASNICLGWDGKEFADFYSRVQGGYNEKFEENYFLEKFPKTNERHHRVACATVMNRLVTVKAAEQCVANTVAASQSGESTKTDKDCAAAAAAGDSGSSGATAGSEKAAKNKNNSWMWWLLGGAAAFAVCVFGVCKSGKKKKKHVPMPVGKPSEPIKVKRPSTTGGVGGGSGTLSEGAN